MKKRSLEERKQKIVEFIKNNPKATYRLIKKELKLNPGRAFKNLEEAYKEAGVKPSRSFEIKTKEEKKKIIIEYIKRHPKVGGQTIRKDTKINFLSIFRNTEEAFKTAGIDYPREIDKRTREKKRKEIISLVKNNPAVTITEMMKKIKVNPYNFFRDIKEIYKIIGIDKVKANEKRRIKKKQKIVEFIKDNPLATQREINKHCKTHVQEMFGEGIFEAYKKAGISFPYERLSVHGTAIKEIKNRAKSFEDNIAIKLSGYGKVNRLVKTIRGFADIIFERKDKKAVIEIKNYEAKDISISQIKQLNKYLEDCDCTTGFLVCIKKPKKDKFLIGKNKIIVLEESEINKIPELIEGTVS